LHAQFSNLKITAFYTDQIKLNTNQFKVRRKRKKKPPRGAGAWRRENIMLYQGGNCSGREKGGGGLENAASASRKARDFTEKEKRNCTSTRGGSMPGENPGKPSGDYLLPKGGTCPPRRDFATKIPSFKGKNWV